MALQLGALRDALLDAGAKPETADRAAEELAGLSHVDDRLKHMDWKINAIMAVVIVMLGSQFLLWSKLGEVSGQLAQIAGRLHP